MKSLWEVRGGAEGGDSLRIAMMTVGGIGAWSAIYLFYRAGRSLIQDMDAVSN